MRKFVFLLIWLVLGCSMAHADLAQLQQMRSACKSSYPESYIITHWSQACPNGECFAWRLTCSNGTHHDLQSAENPNTSDVQHTFRAWSPWSFGLYLVPLLVYAVVALMNVETPFILAGLDAIFLLYFAEAGISFASGATADPWASRAIEDVLFNSYVLVGVLIAFGVVNLAGVWRGVEYLFYRHPTAPTPFPGQYAQRPEQALLGGQQLWASPSDMANHYRRETERLKAHRDHLNAHRSLFETYLRMQRQRNEQRD
jgi:hypothetical protein